MKIKNYSSMTLRLLYKLRYLAVFILVMGFTKTENNLNDGWYVVSEHSLAYPKDTTAILANLTDDNFIISINNIDKIQFSNSQTSPHKKLEIQYDAQGKELWKTQVLKWENHFFVFVLDQKIESIIYVTKEISDRKVAIRREKSDLKRIKKYLKKHIVK